MELRQRNPPKEKRLAARLRPNAVSHKRPLHTAATCLSPPKRRRDHMSKPLAVMLLCEHFSLGCISYLLPEPTTPFPIYETLPPEFSALTRRLPDFSTSAHCLQNGSKNIPHFCCYNNIDIDKRRLFKVEWFHNKKELRFSYDTNCQGDRCGSINCFAVPDCAKMI